MKITKYIVLLLFLLVSIYYTNYSISVLREKDPIMRKIEDSISKYEIKPINAEIIENTIIPGLKGIEVDINKSFNEMKKYGSYNEAMTVLKEIEPTISVNNHYDKYISSGNNENRLVSIIFKVEEKKDIRKVISILKEKEVPSTFFIDGNDLDRFISIINKNKNNQYEILSFKGKYNSSFMKTSMSYLENITKEKTNYCYTEEENNELLNLCRKESKHTIKPKYIFKDNLLKQVKENLENGMIISITINSYTEEELSTVIDYINKKGYRFVTVNTLLTE